MEEMAAQMERTSLLAATLQEAHDHELGRDRASSNGNASSRGGESDGLIASHCTFLGRLPGEKEARSSSGQTFCLRVLPLAQDLLGGKLPLRKSLSDQGSQDGSKHESESSGLSKSTAMLSSITSTSSNKNVMVRMGTDWIKDLRTGDWRQEAGLDALSLRAYDSLTMDNDGLLTSFGSIPHYACIPEKKKCRVCAFSTIHQPPRNKHRPRCKFGALCDFCHSGHKRFIHRRGQ